MFEVTPQLENIWNEATQSISRPVEQRQVDTNPIAMDTQSTQLYRKLDYVKGTLATWKETDDIPNTPVIEDQIAQDEADYQNKVNYQKIEKIQQSIVNKSIAEIPQPKTANDMFGDMLGGIEGTKNHVDHLGIITNAYGVVNDPKNQPKLTAYNRKVAESIGIDLDTATPDESKKVAVELSKKVTGTLSKQVPNWQRLTPESRVYVLDAKYNTGQTFKVLPKKLEQYQNNPTKANLKQVGRAARRKAGGKYSKGMDNRVARIMKSQGLIKTLSEARKYGLPLASD